MSKLPTFQSYNLSSGMVSYVADDLLPSSAATLSVNLNYDIVGNAEQRNGTAIIGTQVDGGSSVCDGLAQFITSNRTGNYLVSAFGGNNYAYNGTSWSNIGGGMTPGTPVRYTSFWDRLFRVGGGQDTYSWNGSGTFTGVTGAPKGKYVMPYKQRLYIAGDPNYTNRLWFSTIADFTGTITWDTGPSSTQFIDFSAGKANDVITGLGKISNLLLIFLDNVMYRWNGSSTDPEIVVDIGCSSNESIVNAKGLVYFFNPTGIYTTDGEYPNEISRPIYDWIAAISPSNYSKIYGGSDSDHVYFNIGDVTLTKSKRPPGFPTSRTFTNVSLVFTISSKNWQVYSYANGLRYLCTYVGTDNSVSLVSGDSLGNVLKLNSGTTDYGDCAINYEWQGKEEILDSRATTKQINKMAWFVDNGVGAMMAVSADGEPFHTIGQVRGRVTVLPPVNVRGHYFIFKLFGSNKGAPIVFSGFEAFDASTFGYVKTD